MAFPAQNDTTAASGHTNIGDLVQLVEAARSLKELPTDVETVAGAGIKAAIRQARGLPPLKPRQQKPKQLAQANDRRGLAMGTRRAGALKTRVDHVTCNG